MKKGGVSHKSRFDPIFQIPGTPYLIIVGSESKTNVSAEFPPDFNNLTKALCEPQPSDIIRI